MSRGLGNMQREIMETLQQEVCRNYNDAALPRGVQNLSACRRQIARRRNLGNGSTPEHRRLNASFSRAARRLLQAGYLTPIDGLEPHYVRIRKRV